MFSWLTLIVVHGWVTWFGLLALACHYHYYLDFSWSLWVRTKTSLWLVALKKAKWLMAIEPRWWKDWHVFRLSVLVRVSFVMMFSFTNFSNGEGKHYIIAHIHFSFWTRVWKSGSLPLVHISALTLLSLKETVWWKGFGCVFYDELFYKKFYTTIMINPFEIPVKKL